MALPDGPRYSAAIQTLRFITRPLPFFDECRRDFGDFFTVRFLGLGPCVHVVRPETVRELMVAPPDHVHAGDSNSLIEPLVGGSSVALVDEGDHARVRRLLKGPLHGQRMRMCGAEIVAATHYALRDWRVGEVRSMLPTMQAISLEVILRVVFGVRERHLLPAAAKAVLDMVLAYTPAMLVLPPLRRDFGRFSPGGRFAQRRRLVNDWLLGEIARRRRHIEEGREAEAPRDVLGLLLTARNSEDAPLSDMEIRDQLITLFVAGQDTTSAALAWALAQLHAHPAALWRLVDEIDALGPDPDPEVLAALPYLDAVCNESLRAMPTVLAASRVAVRRPLRLQGMDVDAGCYLSPNIYLIHMNEAVYDDPRSFRPERFLNREYSPYEFMAFGGGARRCLGMALSAFEMRVVLGTLLGAVRLSAERRLVPRPVMRGMVMVPAHGARLHVTALRRQPNEGGTDRAQAAA